FTAGTGTSQMHGFGGNDQFTWQAGDGVTTMDGGTGFNTLEVSGSPKADTVSISADPKDHHLIVGVNGVNIAATSMQAMFYDTGGGGDNAAVNDLSQTVLQFLAFNLAREGANADSAVDTYTINGPAGPKAITINDHNVSATVTQTDPQTGKPVTKTVTGTLEQVAGLGPTFLVGNPEDKLVVNPAAGNDTVV